MNESDKELDWLVRPTTIRLLWWIFSAILALTVVAQFFIKVKGHFAVETWLGFGAVFGFLCCVLMVVIAKGMGYLLKRDQDYYEVDNKDD